MEPAWETRRELSSQSHEVNRKDLRARMISAGREMKEKLAHFFVKKVYADHNSSRSVRLTLESLIAGLPADGLGLNIGAGRTRFDGHIKNLELKPGEGIDYVGSVERIPVGDAHFDLVIAQEVLEHVEHPTRAAREIFRVLNSGGLAYVQLPFIIGYHPCPNDYWRFTHEGILGLMKSAGFEIVQTGVTVGPATGFYRIAVEFVSVAASVVSRRLYKPAKFLSAASLYPMKLLDPIMLRSSEANRICGGYFLVCRKPCQARGIL